MCQTGVNIYAILLFAFNALKRGEFLYMMIKIEECKQFCKNGWKNLAVEAFWQNVGR